MEIKKARILHKRLTKDKWLQSTLYNLRQGEIGALISEKGDIIEVRIGLRDLDGNTGMPFFDCMLLGAQESAVETVQQYSSLYTFPSIGSENCLYIDKSNDALYRWDAKDFKFYCVSNTSTISNINSINGGGANTSW